MQQLEQAETYLAATADARSRLPESHWTAYHRLVAGDLDAPGWPVWASSFLDTVRIYLLAMGPATLWAVSGRGPSRGPVPVRRARGVLLER